MTEPSSDMSAAVTSLRFFDHTTEVSAAAVVTPIAKIRIKANAAKKDILIFF